MFRYYLTCIFCVLAAVSATNTNNNRIPIALLNQILVRPFAPTMPVTGTPICLRDSQEYLDGLAALTPWALNMFDASAKFPSGVLTGHTQLLGNFDQCLRIRHQAGYDNRSMIRGQYCTPIVKIIVGNKNETQEEELAGVPGSSFLWAFCVPASCSHQDVATALRHWLSPLDTVDNVQVDVAVSEKQCVTEEDVVILDEATIAFICVLTLIVILVIASTVVDILKWKESSLKKGLFVSFSLYSNSKRLFNAENNKDVISCLNGLRFLSLCWVVFGHSCFITGVNPLLNAADILSYPADWRKMIVMNATLSTDTFLLLSGILLSYIFMREMSKTRSLNLVMFYVNRYIRLTPVYAMIIFFYATLMVYISSGPLWKQWVGTNNENCQINWWINLLYVNNYVNVSKPCMDHTWYMAVDMQLYWVSPLFIYPLWRWPKFGKIMLAAGMIGTVLAQFIVTYVDRLAGAMFYLTSDEEVIKVFTLIYIRTYNRAGPYIIGIFLGYHIYHTKDNVKEINKIYVILCWLMSATCCLAVLYGVYGMYQPTHVYDVVEASFYAGFHRSTWALGVAWVVYACVRGYGGPVNSILSWRLFVPVSRVTYSAYLSHYIVLLYTLGTVRTSGYISDYTLARSYLSNLIIIIALGTIICLLIEIPFMNVGRILMLSLAGGSTSKEDADPVTADIKMKQITEFEPSKNIPTIEGISIIKNSANVSFLESATTLDNSNARYKMYDNVGYS